MNLEVHLTFDEYCQLLIQAGLKSSDLGVKGYHLARFNDEGHYTLGNCRFLHYRTNLNERKLTDAMRAASKKNILEARKFMSIKSPELLREMARRGGLASQKIKPTPRLEQTGVLQERMKLLSESGIDVNAWGSRKKIGQLWGISPQKVSGLIDRYKKLYDL